MQMTQKEWKPKIVAFCCNWCSYAGADLAGSSRVCPQGIPLHLLNRKFIKDINELYGEYQAGEDPEARGPLTNYTQGDAEPSVVQERSGE